MLILCHAATATAGENQTSQRDRFDQIIIPAVEESVRQPITSQGGEIAWGESYQLSACVEMFSAGVSGFTS